jgi:hypothetical protein
VAFLFNKNMNYTDLVRPRLFPPPVPNNHKRAQEANLVDNPGGGIRECRICLDTEVAAGDEFIAPCRCKGSSKWIHRKCLDSWRATKHTDRAFTHCRECQFEYRVRVIDPNTEGGAFCNARCKFRALVARDSLFAFLLLQSMICGRARWAQSRHTHFSVPGIGLIFKALDTKNEDVRKFLPHFINHGEKSGRTVRARLFHSNGPLRLLCLGIDWFPCCAGVSIFSPPPLALCARV